MKRLFGLSILSSVVIFLTTVHLAADEKSKTKAKAVQQQNQNQKAQKTEHSKKAEQAKTEAELRAIIKAYRAKAALSSSLARPSQSAESTVNQLLGVRSSSSHITPRPSAYIYSPRTSPSNYGSLYGRPNHSQYRSLNSRLRQEELSRYPSIYQNPNATHIFYPRRRP